MIRMSVLPEKPVLVIIDVQEGFRSIPEGKWSSLDYGSNIAKLIGMWRRKGWKIIHVRHDSRNPESALREGKPGFEFQEEALPLPGETVITKHVNSAFIGTNLENMLRKEDAGVVVICGLVTDHCVSTTARMSGNLGFNTVVVEDACAAYSKKDTKGKEIDALTIHRVNLASINGEFAKVLRTSDITQDH